MNTIKAAVEKDLLSANIEHLYNAVFDKCVDWFAPTNKKDDEYRLAQDLHDIGLLDMRRTSRHRGGCFRGYRVEFKKSGGAA